MLAAKTGASDELLAKLLHAHAGQPGAVPIDLLLCEAQQQNRLLRDGLADVALLHLPFDSTDGLDIEKLTTEIQIAVLPAVHRSVPWTDPLRTHQLWWLQPEDEVPDRGWLGQERVVAGVEFDDAVRTPGVLALQPGGGAAVLRAD